MIRADLVDVPVGKVAMADNYRLGVLAGDGIGPESVPAAVDVLDAAVAAADGAPIEWVPLPVGAEAIETHGSALRRSRWRRSGNSTAGCSIRTTVRRTRTSTGCS